MKKLLFMTMAVLSLALSSCGGSGIKPADPAITYEPWSNAASWPDKYENVSVKGCYEVVSVAATVIPDEDYPSIHSQIKATVNVKTITEPASDGNVLHGYCSIQLLDKDGVVLAETHWGVKGRNEMFNSEAGEVNAVSAVLGDKWSKDTAEEMFAKVKYIRLAGVGCGYEKKKVTDSSEEFAAIEAEEVEIDDSFSSDSDASASSENWSAVLDSYEKYVDKYIALLKKAQAGDVSAISEYPALLQQAEVLSEKLSKAQNSMSTSEWARYTKITQKMANALS